MRQLVLAVTFAGFMGCAGIPFSSAHPKSVAQLAPYELGLVTVEVVAHGDTLPFLFDTGGAQTLLTPATATQMGCAPTGGSVERRMTGQPVHFAHCRGIAFSIGGVEFTHSEVAVFDLASILGASARGLAGLISLKSFARQPFTLDLGNRELILESRQSLAKRTAGMTRLVSRIAHGHDGRALRVFIKMARPAPGWYLFDSANMGVVLVSSGLAGRSAADTAGAVITGPVQFEGLPSSDARWRTFDIIYDGALSEEFLRAWVVTLDLETGRVWGARAASREAA